jgi:hypothetical protein
MKETKAMTKYLGEVFGLKSVAGLAHDCGVLKMVLENAIAGHALDQQIMALYFSKAYKNPYGVWTVVVQ